MKIVTETLSFSTRGDTDIIDITDKVTDKLKSAKLKNGAATISVFGSTGALTTCEYEPALVKDLKDAFERLIPKNRRYAHDDTWGDANGFSHLRASLVGPSLNIPFSDGSLVLGTWQQIIFIDFDNRSRRRKIILQFIGE